MNLSQKKDFVNEDKIGLEATAIYLLGNEIWHVFLLCFRK